MKNSIVKILKKIWNILPLNFKIFFKPFIINVVKVLYALFGAQYLPHSIGKVGVPLFTRPLMKRSFAQQGEDLILDRIITRVLNWDTNKNYNYIDVGAYDAIDHSVTYLLYLRGWKGVVFDPSITTEKSFRFWRKRDKFIRAVVGDEDNTKVNFYIPNSSNGDKSLTSSKYPPKEKIENYKKLTFNQVNLNNELKRQGINKVDFLNLDVEGAELEIINSFDFEFFKPSIIAIEIHGNNIEKWLQTDEAKTILSKGYQAVGSAVITHFFVRKDEIV